MFTLIATTKNTHKFQEIERILDLPFVEVRSLAGFGPLPDIPETGNTFRENAALKARGYFRHLNRPLFADDSGLIVPALDHQPGVFSARYAGPDATYAENNKVLIEKISRIPGHRRIGRFVCTICFKDEEGEHFFTGVAQGIILEEQRGSGGFGYDPLFYLPALGKTYAQLLPEEKNAISHRGRAIRKLRTFLINKYGVNQNAG